VIVESTIVTGSVVAIVTAGLMVAEDQVPEYVPPSVIVIDGPADGGVEAGATCAIRAIEPAMKSIAT